MRPNFDSERNEMHMSMDELDRAREALKRVLDLLFTGSLLRQKIADPPLKPSTYCGTVPHLGTAG